MISNFRNALNNNALSTVKASGPTFTWDNNRKHPFNISERLDRFVGNDHWKMHYPDYKSENLDIFNTDHIPILLNTKHKVVNSGSPLHRTKQFSFEQRWILEDDFEDVIKTGWCAAKDADSLGQKLASLSSSLLHKDKFTVGSLKNSIKSMKTKLEYLLNSSINAVSDEEINKQRLFWKSSPSKKNYTGSNDPGICGLQPETVTLRTSTNPPQKGGRIIAFCL